MPANARVGDSTFGCGSHGKPCCGHCFSGTHVEGSPDTRNNSRALVRARGDAGSHSCPHCGSNFTINGAVDKRINSREMHRVGDSVTEVCGSGQTVSGSSDTRTA